MRFQRSSSAVFHLKYLWQTHLDVFDIMAARPILQTRFTTFLPNTTGSPAHRRSAQDENHKLALT